jgi:hypothetical protein
LDRPQDHAAGTDVGRVSRSSISCRPVRRQEPAKL